MEYALNLLMSMIKNTQACAQDKIFLTFYKMLTGLVDQSRI